MPFMPWFPPIWQAMPTGGFDGIVAQNGVQLQWAKSHNCACVAANTNMPGSPDAACTTCFGRGVYWDNFSSPFTGLITFIHMSPTPDEPGTYMDEQFGSETNGEPALTITEKAGSIWSQASINDLFIEPNSIARYNASLQVGVREYLPYPQVCVVAPSGAVTIYVGNQAVPVSGYSVSGSHVTLPSGYPESTPYTVEFTAASTWVAWRIAGAPPHNRPFGDETLPKRFRLQTLDVWMRNQGLGDHTPVVTTLPSGFPPYVAG